MIPTPGTRDCALFVSANEIDALIKIHSHLSSGSRTRVGELIVQNSLIKKTGDDFTFSTPSGRVVSVSADCLISDTLDEKLDKARQAFLKAPTHNSRPSNPINVVLNQGDIDAIIAMGFSEEDAQRALRIHSDVSDAVAFLL